MAQWKSGWCEWMGPKTRFSFETSSDVSRLWVYENVDGEDETRHGMKILSYSLPARRTEREKSFDVVERYVDRDEPRLTRVEMRHKKGRKMGQRRWVLGGKGKHGPVGVASNGHEAELEPIGQNVRCR